MSSGLVLLLGLIPFTQRPITTPQELLAAMRARYESKWYRTLRFVQYNTEHHPDGTVARSVWREWIQSGKMRIEFQPADSGNGILFTNDSLYDIRHDSVARARPFVYPLLALGFDVYIEPLERTTAHLQQAPRVFDLAILSEGTWNGRPVWIVGARAGDLHSRQFWVDKERLVFVRMLEPSPRDASKTAESRFNKYEPRDGAWVFAEEESLVDGQQQSLAQFQDIETNITIPAASWDARQWKAVRGQSR